MRKMFPATLPQSISTYVQNGTLLPLTPFCLFCDYACAFEPPSRSRFPAPEANEIKERQFCGKVLLSRIKFQIYSLQL